MKVKSPEAKDCHHLEPGKAPGEARASQALARSILYSGFKGEQWDNETVEMSPKGLLVAIRCPNVATGLPSDGASLMDEEEFLAALTGS
jgi:hypothetical protein